MGSAADEFDLLDVVAMRGAVDHEAVADHLHEFGTQTFGQFLAGLLGGQASAADEFDLLDVVAMRGAVDHEAVADHLHEFGTQTFGQFLAGLLGGQAGAVEHIAFDELALLDCLIGLLDGRIGQVVLADLDDRVEMVGQRLELLDLLLRQRHDRMCLPAVVVRTRVRPADHGRCRIVQVCKRPSTVREGAENPGDNPADVR